MHTHSLVFRTVANILSIEDEVWNHLGDEVCILKVMPSDGSMIAEIDSNGVPYGILEGKMNEWMNDTTRKQKDNGLVWWQRVEEVDLYNA